MTKKQRVIVLVIVLLVVAGSVWHWESKNRANEQEAKKAGVNTDQKIGEEGKKAGEKISGTTEKGSWKVVTYEKYGYQMTLTDAWVNYRYNEVRAKKGDYYLAAIYYSVPTTDATWENGSGRYSPLVINVFRKEDWNRLSSQNGPAPIYLAENGEYVFAYSVAQDVPSDWVNKDLGVSQIVKSFVLVK